MLKKLAFSAVVLLLVVLFSQLGSQYATLYVLRDGLAQRDAAKVIPLVDFESVKTDVKSQLEIALRKKTPELNSTVDAALLKDVQQYAIDMQNKVLDGTITPQMLTKLMELQAKDKSVAPWELKASYKFIDVSSFSVEMKTSADTNISVIFGRTGLFSWQVKKLVLPQV